MYSSLDILVKHALIVACSSLAFAFMLLLISHAIITAFACIYCIMFLVIFGIVIPTSLVLLFISDCHYNENYFLLVQCLDITSKSFHCNNVCHYTSYVCQVSLVYLTKFSCRNGHKVTHCSTATASTVLVPCPMLFRR